MLHSDQDVWPAPQGANQWQSSANTEGEAIRALAREIEDMQRQQGESMSLLVHRLRALEERTQHSGSTPPPASAKAAATSEEPWDATSAEALMQSYEGHAGNRDQTLDPHSGSAAATQDWIGHRFSDVTDRIRRTLTDLKPGSTLALLEERLEKFQQHIASALEDVVRRSDLEGIRLIEAHVADLGAQLLNLERQVARLDGIEADVRSVLHQVSDERIAQLIDGGPRFAADLEAVALRAAEEVHARFGRSDDASARRHDELRAMIEASLQDRRTAEAGTAEFVSGLSGRFSAQDDRYEELKSLISQSAQDQRQSEQTAISMLDTLQQALVQVLDRIDVLERGPAARSTPEAAAAAPSFAPPPPPVHAAIADAAAALSAHFERPQAPPVQDEPAAGTDEAEPHFDRMRRDFVADARRAKMKAAANRAEAVTTAAKETPSATRSARAAIAQAARIPAAGAAGGTRFFGASPKLLAAALAAVVVINGGMLMMSRKTTPPAAPALTIQPSTDTAPAQSAPEGDLAPGPRTDADPSEGKTFADAPDSDSLLTPYGLNDDVLNPPALDSSSAAFVPPRGMTIARPAGSMPDEVVAGVYEDQVLASLSGKLGNIVAGKTTDALLPEEHGRVDVAYPDDTQSTAGAASIKHANGLDLPAATVGPLSLRLAAANGDASAEFEVAARLAEGKGTEQNYAEALRWYQRSAGKGFAQAQYRLGTFYERGFGVAQDVERAKVWYTRAAEQGNVKSMHNLAVLAAGGESGNPDYSGAHKWFVKAADHGLADSQYNLGVLLENGLGTKVDKVQAYKWYALAAKSGDTDALARRDALRTSLSGDEMKAADRLVVAFKAQTSVPLANDARAAGEDWKKRAKNDASR